MLISERREGEVYLKTLAMHLLGIVYGYHRPVCISSLTEYMLFWGDRCCWRTVSDEIISIQNDC